jgi:hypothetical protein
MKKLLKSNKKQLPIIFMMVLPCLCLANGFSDQNLKQQVINTTSYSYQGSEYDPDLLNIFDNYVDNVVNSSGTLNSESKLLPKGKSELEKILGTWIVSYSINGSGTFTDRLEINEVRQAGDNGYIAAGKVFLSGSGNEQTIGCDLLSPEELVSHFLSDYMCLAVGSENFEQYTFRISDDKIVGYYGQGTTFEDAGLVLLSKTISFTGHRKDSDENLAHYDGETGKLVIPRVSYNNTNFRVVLQDTGGFIFSVKQAQPVVDENTSDSSYDEFTGELEIPSVVYRGSKFKVILQNSGDFVFSIKKATPL